MEALCFSETSIATQQTTRRHIPEDDTLQINLYLLFIYQNLDPVVFIQILFYI
jgi:hypothetical protein